MHASNAPRTTSHMFLSADFLRLHPPTLVRSSSAATCTIQQGARGGGGVVLPRAISPNRNAPRGAKEVII